MPDAFRGESLAGWTTERGGSVTQGWEASSGEIRLNRAAGRGGHIITAVEYDDFDLSFEWKIAARGNSGLKYRVHIYGNQTLGLEYQICDEPAGRPVTKKSAGALYDLYEPAAERQLKPAGEWNTARIVVRGDRIEHWLNGGLIIAATVGGDEWKKRIGESKFVDQEQFGENRAGRIMLTDHGSDVGFRNFVFQPLMATAFERDVRGPTFRVESNLLAAVAKINITPPAGMPVAGHVRPTDGFRNRLHAEVLLLFDGQTKAAIVTTDLISASSELVDSFREVVAARTGTSAENIMITASHNHSGPRWDRQSEWGRRVLADLDAALGKAAGDLSPVTIGYGVDQINFNINRRALVNGKSVVRLNPDGLCDRRVKVLRLDDGRSLDPMAILMHAVCHACVHTWGDRFSPPHPGGYPQGSSDFPGEARDFVEMVYSGRTKAMFLQGCAGDIRPNLPGYPYRCGDEADIRWIARNLGTAVVRAADYSVIREELAKRPKIYPIRCASKTVTLPSSKPGETIQCPLQAMKIGPYLLLTIPGEPMVEYGFRLEKAIGDRAVPIVVGYANGNLGYICTAKAFDEGGYEPAHSQAGPGAEEIIIAELLGLVDRVVGDVFEAFRPAAAPGADK